MAMRPCESRPFNRNETFCFWCNSKVLYYFLGMINVISLLFSSIRLAMFQSHSSTTNYNHLWSEIFKLCFCFSFAKNSITCDIPFCSMCQQQRHYIQMRLPSFSHSSFPFKLSFTFNTNARVWVFHSISRWFWLVGMSVRLVRPCLFLLI